ncbi:PREDICTED: erythroferrone [Leptosomus discolor]|uniref:erythroferrone n=1 Tax=Leptosomus discolor TaxID=188344 RepID=UPI0005229811|nr:PREDICTED: erythroferrone [Leptosomus discolor]
MFHHGLGLNLTSAQYTAPITGYYTFTAALHINRVSAGEWQDLFTVSITAILYLQAGQYASGFVDNTAGSPLTVQSSSGFSAILLGA